jgi:WD40 repeat protein
VDALTNAELAATRAAEAVMSAGLAATREVEAINSAGVAAARQAEAEVEANLRATAEAVAIEERETAEQQRAIAEQQQAFAEQQADLATSRELALVAIDALERDPELSILLALQAVETAYTQAAEDALHRAVQQSRLRQAFPGVGAAAYHPDGTKVATISTDGFLMQVWDLATNQAVLTVTLPVERSSRIAYSPDGRTIATGHEGGVVILWDAASGAERRQFVGHTEWVYSVVFSPDGRRLASSSYDGLAILWDLDNGEPLFTFPGVVRWSHQIAFSPDGALLAVPELGEGEAANETGVVHLWDTASGALRLTLVGPGLDVFDFSPDGAYLATGAAGNRVIIWDLAASLAAGTGQPLGPPLDPASVPRGGAFNPDGNIIAISTLAGTAVLWDVSSGQELLTLAGHTSEVYSPVFSPDGRRLLTRSTDGARIWDVSFPGNEEVMVLAGPDSSGETVAALSSDGAYLAVGGISGAIHLHDAITGEPLAILSGHSKGIFRMAFSPDDRRLATAAQDGLVIVWDVAGSLAAGQGQELLALDAHDPNAVIGGLFSGVQSVAYNYDGTRLATSGADGMVRLWDATNGNLLAEVMVREDGAGVWAVDFSPDGQYLAAGTEITDAIVKVWRLAGDSLIDHHTLTGFPSRVGHVAFSPDSSLLVTSGAGNHVALWDVSTGELVYSFSGHASTVRHAAFSSDGRTLASAGLDGFIRLWDVASGNNFLILPAASPWSIAFSPDGAYLYASNRAGELRVYAVQLEALVSLARSRLTRSLTDEECRQYLHLEACPVGSGQ